MSRYRKVVTAGVLAFSLISSHEAAPLTGTATSTAPVVIDVTGDSISYQGRLTDSGSLASGSYDFQFLLKDADGNSRSDHCAKNCDQSTKF
jgi:hypothetical protein